MQFIINIGVAAYVKDGENTSRALCADHESFIVNLECKEENAPQKIRDILNKVVNGDYT